MNLPNLSIEFLEDKADGLRSATLSNWSGECLLSSRRTLPTSLANENGSKWLDVPGVYLLIGPPVVVADVEQKHEAQLYIGQADSLADRLESHLKAEKMNWWQAAAMLRRLEKNPLNLSQCKFLESRLCTLALKADKVTLFNANSPQLPAMSASDRSGTEEFLEKALIIMSALGWNFFQPPPIQKPDVSQSKEVNEPPEVPPNLKPLLEEIRNAVTGPSLPNAIWYWTRTPDYRSKLVGIQENFRVFARITWARKWFIVKLANVDKYKVKTSADIDDELRKAIAKAYQKAEQYLQRGK
jgi:hypothetical protein